MSKKLICAVFMLLWGMNINAQRVQKPKVVVGIVIDQMRADYLTNFEKHYTRGGFNLLKQKGAWFRNCYINYLPAHTGPGHACIYTGSVPSIHGIVGNHWYDNSLMNTMYCVSDTGESAVGGALAAGMISPRNLKTTTIADELRLATNHKSRTFAISLKDRGAVLPGGHTSNASYWMDGEGNFMSSSYYMKALPNWATDFNNQKYARKYLDLGWNTLYARDEYLYDNQANNNYEGSFGDGGKNIFPYSFKKQSEAYIKRTPYGNSILFDFAIQAIEHEGIGRSDETDFLALSFSATDYVGHVFGPNSLEVEDTYARFDNDLADFIYYLDNEYGKDNYLLFLTADHGAAHNPNYLKDKHVPADYFFDQKEQVALNTYLESRFGVKDLCVKLMNCQVYLDVEKLKRQRSFATINKDYALEDASIKKAVIEYFNKHKLVQLAFETDKVSNLPLPNFLKEYYYNSYFAKRSGDVSLILYPAVLDAYSTTGTSHGAWSAYDTHIPLLFYGNGIKKGVNNQRVFMTDIAPTIANLLGITSPNGSIGNALLR